MGAFGALAPVAFGPADAHGLAAHGPTVPATVHGSAVFEVAGAHGDEACIATTGVHGGCKVVLVKFKNTCRGDF